MSFANPTGLTIGASGILASKRFSVLGRVVMGMEDQGETYFWNEFHLIDEANQSATLVYEETERGPQWKLFTCVEPSGVWTANEAAAKGVGDPVEIDGMTARVTLVDESRVYFVEGQPPEGVEAGDVARYFNAMAGNRMYVVSWTGDEVEIFRGMDLPTQAVASAFQFQTRTSPVQLGRSSISSSMTGHPGDSSGWIVKVIVYVLMGVIGFASFRSCRSGSRGNAFVPVKPPTPAAPLVTGASGTLEGKTWRVAGHALVEVRKPGSIHERHEYQLVDDDGATARLVCGFDPGSKEWRLLRPVELDVPLTPDAAASKRAGEFLGVQSQTMVIKQLFQTSVRLVEGEPVAGLQPGAVAYSFRAESKDAVLLVSWTQSGLVSQLGMLVPEKQVLAAFGKKPGTTRW